MDLPDVQAARVEAVRLLGSVLGEAPEQFWKGQEFVLDVSNCDRELLFCLTVGCHDGATDAQAADGCPDGFALKGGLKVGRPTA